MTVPDIAVRPIQILADGQTDAGQKRGENQDNFLIADLSLAAPDGGFLLASDGSDRHNVDGGGFVLGPKGALIVVADGMGGAAGGRIASKLAMQWIYREMAARWGADRNDSPPRFATHLREAVEQANARIHEQSLQTPELRGMGSTATAVGVLDGFLYIAQVGDSRAYLVRDGKIHQLTRDQSLVQELVEAGTMTEAEAEASSHANVILQALGVENEVRVDLTYQQIRRGDTVLACSDGLFKVVRNDGIARTLAQAPDLNAACAELIALANAKGGPDNITVAAARFDGFGLQPAQETDAVGRQPFTPSASV